MTELAHVGVVVIGRNEGQRLVIALDALIAHGPAADRIVYVDSGSTDGSVDVARTKGVHVIELSPPFTAAKGRNAGWRFLLDAHPSLVAIQFVDGDCEYDRGYLEAAARTLADDSSIGAVTGHQRERHPDATVYNRLVDIEWQGGIGDIESCAGNVMIRAAVLTDTGGYDEHLIAGEDPELYVRIRKRGLRLVRIDVPMCLHDVDMTAFSQWWKRAVRAGHAFAEVSRRHGEAPLHFWRKETRSNFMWGAALPMLAAPLVPPAYGALFLKVYRAARARGMSAEHARAYAFFIVIGKVPAAVGQAQYWWGALRGRTSTIIEYK